MPHPQPRTGPGADSKWSVAAAAAPVALVNATAFIGQFAWVRANVPLALPYQLLFSVAVESVAIYLAWHAHKAMLANDSAGRLKAGAYGFALVIGAMNYSHWAYRWHPSALAIGFGLMSALSPWLWGIHSRRVSRDRLMETGQVEGHSVRLGGARWMWHPVRSVVVTSQSAWTGETSLERAISVYEASRPKKAPVQDGTVPALPGQSAPEQALAPAAPVPAIASPAPAQAAPGATVNGNAVLAAAATLGRKAGPADEAVADARKQLAGWPAGEKLPSQRKVAGWLGNAENFRRSAQNLLDEAAARRAAEPVASVRRLPTQMIASPANSLPGGIPANG